MILADACFNLGLLGEFNDSELPKLMVSLAVNLSTDKFLRLSSRPAREVESGSASILSRDGSSSTAGMAYSASSSCELYKSLN